MINTSKLTGHIPDKVLSKISGITEITNDLRLAHFLSQCSHESANFTRVYENLNYSADGLLKTFPKYFTHEQALAYAHKPHDIANRVYADRIGNGNEHSGDGWKYRGKGYLQVTFRDNYVLASGYLGKDLTDNPDLMATEFSLESAAWFFTANNIWSKCDTSDVARVTKAINGGTHGLEQRIELFNKFYNLLVR